MNVQAAPGLRCPMEHNPREYITDEAKGVEVADTAYYRRLVDDGSLVLIVPVPKKAKGGDQ